MTRFRPPVRSLFVGALALAFASPFLPANALGDQAPPPALRHRVFSDYEQATIDEALLAAKLSLDPSPEGKTIERIEIVPLDVYEGGHWLLSWINIFHTKTRKAIIAREVLLRPGDVYEQANVDDTIRNIRRMPGVPQLSAVLAFAAKGATENGVVLVVVTKDVWSLRLNWGLVATSGGVDSLVVQPSETNVAGLHHVGSGTFVLEPSSITTGAGYMIPRLGDSRVALQAYANVMMSRANGAIDGSYGDLVVGAPLFAGTTKWAWDGNAYFQDIMVRRYSNARLSEYLDPTTNEKIPFEYRARRFRTAYNLTRSFGWDENHDFTLSAIVNRGEYSVPTAGVVASARTFADFEAARVPVSDTSVGPSLQYHTYSMRFVRAVNVDTLALQEDYRLGHDIVARVYPSFSALGASRNFIGTYVAAQYTWAVRDGLFRVAFQATNDFEPSRISDAILEPTLHLVSPSFLGIGRLVLDGALVWRWRNYLNATDYLGGDDRLRGYPTNFFVGKDLVTYNIEFRTRPIDFFRFAEIGAVAFLDIGNATSKGSLGSTYQSAGVGVRGLLPWLDRTIFRADIGIPFERPIDPATHTVDPTTGHIVAGSGRPINGYSFVISFSQAFGTPNVAPRPGALGSLQVPNAGGDGILGLPTGQSPDAP